MRYKQDVCENYHKAFLSCILLYRQRVQLSSILNRATVFLLFMTRRITACESNNSAHL
nr:MAG TPA: Heat-stable enterotoxin B, secretory [Bacteriophage sp.]